MAENWPIIAAVAGIVLYEAYRRGAIKLGGGKKPVPVPVPTPVVPDGDLNPDPGLETLADDYFETVIVHSRCKAEYDAACERLAETKAAYHAALTEELAELEGKPTPAPEVPTDAD